MIKSMPDKPETDFDIFVAGKTGALKGVKVDNNGTIVKNLQNIKEPLSEISILSWSDNSQKDILIGTASQVVRIYDTEFKAFSTSIETKIGSGPLVGLTRINGAVTTCSQSGHIKIWKYKKNEEVELSTEENVSKMQRYFQTEGIVATGGEKNDLKIWNLETKSKIFCAKNVKKTFLELEVPIWVTDMVFLPNNEYKVAVCTRHGQVRLYDTKAQRRPVIDINLKEQTLNTITLCNNENHVVVGSGTGYVLLADLRAKGKIVHSYKGAVGSVRQVVAHTELPYIASVGLDRFLRIHNLETKKLLHQQYLKVRLNCVLMKSTFGKELEKDNEKEDNEEEENVKGEESESDEEYSEMFDNMERVGSKEKMGLVKKNVKKSKNKVERNDSQEKLEPVKKKPRKNDK